MASKYPTYFFPNPIAVSGDKTLPPATAEDAGDGRLSVEQGWGEMNSRPLDEGGIPPDRADFNGLAFAITQLLVWWQQGGQMQYDASVSYEPLNEVFFLGEKYRCLVACQGIAPTNKQYWKNLDKGSALNGAVMPYYNARVGGSDGRRLVPWGSNDADESWILCDGGSDGHGGSVPNLIDRFLMGSAVVGANTTGGSSTVRLNANQIPSHTHAATVTVAGNHTHSRGDMNITGHTVSLNLGRGAVEGAFYRSQRNANANMKYGGGDDWLKGIGFDASRTWSGRTSWDGDHSHQVIISSTGSGDAFSVIPPFFKLAYFVKVIE